MKVCTRCKVNKSVREFGKRPDRPGKYRSWCKDCRKYESLQRTYNLTDIEYDQMLEDQEYGCAICGKVETLRVDHNHGCCPTKISCGKCVRQLLCNDCNLFVGQLEFRPERTKAALAYIETHRKG